MSTLVVRYRPWNSSTADIHALAEAVFDQLEGRTTRRRPLRLPPTRRRHPPTHATITTEPNPLLSLATFTAFSATLAERCEPSNGPQATPAALIGNYRLLA